MRARAAAVVVLALAALAGAADARPSRHLINGVNVLEPLGVGGTEPFWGVSIEGRKVEWSDPNESNEARPGRLDRPRLTRGRAEFAGRLNDGRRIRIVLTKGPCNDDMSDTIDPLTARVWVGPVRGPGLDGCADTLRSIERRNREENQ